MYMHVIFYVQQLVMCDIVSFGDVDFIIVFSQRGEDFLPYRLPKNAQLFVPPRSKTDVGRNIDFLGKAKVQEQLRYVVLSLSLSLSLTHTHTHTHTHIYSSLSNFLNIFLSLSFPQVVSSVVDQDNFTGFVGAQRNKESRSPTPGKREPPSPSTRGVGRKLSDPPQKPNPLTTRKELSPPAKGQQSIHMYMLLYPMNNISLYIFSLHVHHVLYNVMLIVHVHMPYMVMFTCTVHVSSHQIFL